jgi:hypothetical protein
MKNFTRIQPYYTPELLSEAQVALFSKHLAIDLELSEVSAEHERLLALLPVFVAQKEGAIRAFLAEKQGKLTALKTTLLGVRGGRAAFEGLNRALTTLNPDINVTAAVRTCMLAVMNNEETVNTLLDLTNEDEAVRSLLPQYAAIIEVAALFKPLIAAINAAEPPVAVAQEKVDELTRNLHSIVPDKAASVVRLDQMLSEAFVELESEERGLLDLDSSRFVRTFFQELGRDNLGSLSDALKELRRNVDEMPVEKEESFRLIGIIDSIFYAHKDNLKLLDKNIDAARYDFNLRRTRLKGKLDRAIQALTERLPEDDAFNLVRGTCTAIQGILSTSSIAFAQLDDLINTVRYECLDESMRAAYFNKSWHERDGFSDMAGYVMHALESAIRWFLECIHICSSTPTAQMTRENYFFKGPESAIRAEYDSALADLNAIELLLGLENEVEDEAAPSAPSAPSAP